MSDPLYGIAHAAADLKRAAPEQFDRLVAAFRAYEERCKSDLLAAEPNVIVGAQGKAWVAQQLRVKLEDCLTIRETIEKRK